MIDGVDKVRQFWDKDTSWGPIGHLIVDTMPDRYENLQKELAPYIGEMRKNSGASSKILDVAAGAQVVYFPPDLIPFVIPTDISIKKLRTQNVHGRSVLADNRSVLPFTDKQFSWATSFFGMRYLSSGQQINLADEMLKVSGGNTIIIDHEELEHQTQEVTRFSHNEIADLIKIRTGNEPLHKKIWVGAGPTSPGPLWIVASKL